MAKDLKHEIQERLAKAGVEVIEAEMALHLLSRSTQVKLDEERKAAMVSNLLVVLCADREAPPVVNTGTLYH